MSIVTFDKLWDYLIQSNCQIVKQNNKEYIYLTNEFRTISYDSKNDEFLLTIPQYIVRHYIEDELISLRLSGLKTIDVTKNHSMLEYDLKTSKMKAINPSDCRYLPILDNQYCFDTTLKFDSILLGLFIGDGSFTDKYYPSFSFNHRESVLSFLKKLKPDLIIYLKDKYDCHINYKKFSNYLIQEGLHNSKSPDRLLSNKIFDTLNKNSNLLLNFLLGYYLADGSFNSNIITFSSSNYKLLEQINHLLMNIGIYSQINLDKNNRKYKNTLKGDMYKLKLYTTNQKIIDLFNVVFNFKDCDIIKENGTFYGTGTAKPNITRKSNLAKIRNIRAIHIKDKKNISYKDYVYDLCIPQTQNFVANGILVHNTDSIFYVIPTNDPDKKTPEELWDIAMETSEAINNLIIDYTKTTLLPRCNINPDENQTFFKTELLMSALMLLDVKKNYAYKLLVKEGNVLEKPEVSYTGIQVVKSNTAKFTQNLLKEMIESIVLNEKIPNEDKKDYIVKIIDKYHAHIETLIKDFQFVEIGIPGKWAKNKLIINGMKLYNQIMNEEVFTPLSAGRFVYCKFGKNFGKDVNGICVPYSYDEEVLKEKFEINKIIVDKNKQWETLLTTTCHRVIGLVNKLKKDNV